MADEDTVVEEKIVIDYDLIDEFSGFKKAEIDIWNKYEEGFLSKPEADRPDIDSWIDEFSEESKFDKKRVKFVTTVGIYAGPRDEFNQRSGSGKSIYSNGDVYEGDFFEGKKHGVGQYIFKKLGKSEVDKLIEKYWKSKAADESNEAFVSRVAGAIQVGSAIVEHVLEFGFFPCYHGDYARGLRVGQGVMKNKDASVYKGDWKDNKRHGQGIFLYLNGDVYSGQWVEGLKHGFGTYRFADGSEYRGEWNKGTFTQGQWIMRDGTYYEGKFDKKNRPCDEAGSMHFPRKGISMLGAFQKGRWAPLSELHVSEEVPVSTDEWSS
mmetsp:Transcript_31713/g.36628  ORF Transcript_31713/g.36628 Transcript_31713/m.36628 type:complete len:322 (-) Transcript_31713:271-1236(-)